MRRVGFFKDWWAGSLNRRILTAVIGINLLSLSLLGYLSLRIGRNALFHEFHTENMRLATISAKDFNAYFDSFVNLMVRIRQRLEESDSDLLVYAREMLDLRRVSPLIHRAVYLFDGKDRLIIHLAEALEELAALRHPTDILTRPPFSLSKKAMDAYQAAKGEDLYQSGVFLSGMEKTPRIYMGITINQPNGTSLRTLLIEIDLREIWLKVDKIIMGKTGRAFIVSRDGVIIAHPHRRYVGMPVSPMLKDVLRGYEGHAEYTDPFTGKEMFACYSPVGKQTGWGMVLELESDEIMGHMDVIRDATLLVLLATVGVASFVGVMISRSIAKPVRELAGVAQKIAATGDLDQHIVVEGRDEVSQLRSAFNRMMENLQKSRQDLEKLNEELEARVAARTSELERLNRELHETQEELIRKEKLAVLGQLSGSVGHELRNPLGVISNAVYYLKLVQTEADETVKDYLETISEEIDRSAKIVADLLDLSRMRPAEKERVKVSELITEVLDRLKPPENITVAKEIDPGTPLHVDSRQIGQVFMNLLTNACQAMPGGGELKIAATADGDRVRVSFTDTGCGISREDMGKLFEPLFTTKPRGIGLGLAVCRSLAEANEGSIEAESEEGRGTTFTVTLPAAESTEP